MLWKLGAFSIVLGIVAALLCEKIAKKPNTERTLRTVVFGTALIIITAWWFFYWGSPEREPGSYKVNYSLLTTYTEEQYPRFFEKWGKDGVLRIEARDRIALEKVSRQKKCDAVYHVGLAERESTPPEDIVIFANCDNGYQFYVGPDGEILKYRKVH